jgi:hypothetical protein
MGHEVSLQICKHRLQRDVEEKFFFPNFNKIRLPTLRTRLIKVIRKLVASTRIFRGKTANEMKIVLQVLFIHYR